MRSLRLWFCAWVILALVGIEVSPAAADYYTPGSPVKVATGSTAAGYTHTEGPLYDNAGGVLYCELNSTHTNDRIYRYNMSTGANDLLDSNSGGTQGMFFNPSGQIVAADRDHRHVAIRSSADITQETVLVSSYNGKTFNGPNDLAIDSAGGIYFTDPDYENRASLPDAAYYLAPNGTLSQIITIFR
ncbi:MAG TPA: SMP-30/gluconolactonase/LRE family protein, partial [Tepidisphaeraceae bacterium]